MRWSHAAHQASARQSGNSFFPPLGWWGRLGAQRRAVWGGCERKVSWAEQWVGVWVEPSSPARSAALTVPSLWLFSRGSWWEWGGQAAGVCLHTEPCCVPRSFQHMAEALELTKEKKRLPLKKKGAGKVPHTLSGSSFFRLKRASRHLWLVTLRNLGHPVSLAVFMVNQRRWLIYQLPSAPDMLACLDLSWDEEACLQVFLQQIICPASWSHPWHKKPDYTSMLFFFFLCFF